MKAHIDKTKAALGELAGLAAKTEESERRILAAAEERLDAVQSELASVEPKAKSGDSEAEDRYVELIRERGTLNVVIARAKQALGTH